MYIYLLFFHSLFRWIVLISLVYAVVCGIKGWITKTPFSKSDDRVRYIVASLAQIQLTIGYVLYFNSPVIAYLGTHYREAVRQFDFVFFGIIHILLMTVSIFMITVGSSLVKRKVTDTARFRTMTLFYAAALLIIFMSIPWPFSPLANRPFIRYF